VTAAVTESLPLPRGRETSGTGTRRNISYRDRRSDDGYRSRYRLRKQAVEPVVGPMKQPRAFRQFVLRALDKTGGKWSLIRTVHNFLKLAARRSGRTVVP